MDKFLKFITFSLIAALIVFGSCGPSGDDDDDTGPGTNPVQDIVDDLIAEGGSWTIIDGGATLESVAAEGWDSFGLTLGGNATNLSYGTSGSADNTVWPSSGNWTFVDGSDGKKGLRDDGIEVDITASATSLRLEFDIAAGRSKGIVGRWSFTLEK